MTRTGNDAVAWAKDQAQHGSAQWHNMCLSFVRTCFEVGSEYPSATSAWENASAKHRVANGAQCPRAVPVYWTGGSHGFGHIVLSVGGGMCYSTDIKREGHVDLVHIDDITRAWGQNFEGWSEDINSVRIWTSSGLSSEWESGDVYVSKLQIGQRHSDSVKRLQTRLLNDNHVPAKDVKVNGHYDEGTRSAVAFWQREVAKPDEGANDGFKLTMSQAKRLFGDKYVVHE